MSDKFRIVTPTSHKQFFVEMLNKNLVNFKIEERDGDFNDFTITIEELKDLIQYVESKL